ncbi:MAG: Hfq-like protein [Terriglobales bacterium]
MASLNDTTPRHSPDTELVSNRKLIRPSLADVRGQLARAVPHAALPALHPPPSPPARQPKKPVPPEVTNAESFYFLKQMQSKTEMVLVLTDGERIRGVIEWYDRHCLKVHRTGDPNLLLYKSIIKYMYKAEDEGR